MVALKLNENEEKAMKEAFDKIVDFLKAQLPMVRRTIEVKFGYSSYGTYLYEISVSNRYVSGMTGMTHITIMENDVCRGRNPYDEPDFVQALIGEWKSIKAKIMQEIENQKELMDKIMYFEV